MRLVSLILFLIIVETVQAQVGLNSENSTLSEWKTKHFKFLDQPQSDSYLFNIKNRKPLFYLLPNSTTYIPPSFIPIKIDHAPGIFCKIESKLEAKSKLLPRFRLGSLQYTEWMEGKRIWLQ